ncbi:hypothetical protein J5N97_018303 [Dioscorea zingiberensis]|uniref:AMP-binding enzyme C-terminal domain-containing protein n=1 Tax=Dioscorea zingiberensis TaxID=325984 RepID=A0A9D5HH88_9LILI|nr:hypothetical protein J5N97_018303 [Dioscorea zingiberensis]
MERCQQELSELVESYVGMTSSRGGRHGGSNAGRGGRGDVPRDYAQYQSKEARTGKIESLNYKPDGQMVSHSKASTSRASPPPPSGSSDHMPVEASSLDGTAVLPLLALRGPVMDDEEGSDVALVPREAGPCLLTSMDRNQHGRLVENDDSRSSNPQLAAHDRLVDRVSIVISQAAQKTMVEDHTMVEEPPDGEGAIAKHWVTVLSFRVTHTYGLSVTYGPSTVCAWKPEWDQLPPEIRAKLHCRQGVRCLALENLDIVDVKTMAPVPADGVTLGEIVMLGNGVMKGYLKNPKANEAFENGWFHSGDLGVENVSSLEVESALYLHPSVLEVSVVARTDQRWGESPCMFVTPKQSLDSSGEATLAEDIMKFCCTKLPGYWVPKSVVLGLPP